MNFCYVDESGTPQIPGNTTHYILAGISIPVWHWRDCDKEIIRVKAKYDLADQEIHVAWMHRYYLEQKKVPDFENLPYSQRRYEVGKLRNAHLIKLQRGGKSKQYHQTKKSYRKTDPYIHLTHDERKSAILDIAKSVSNWGFARLFAECIDKIHFDPNRAPLPPDEQAFEQLVSRFEQYLAATANSAQHGTNFGVIIHDNNQTVSKRHTELMRRFQKRGTYWTNVQNIIETPLFVDSELTSMVQIADLCGYALRRYLENGEDELFDLIFQRADRRSNLVVGVRHFSDLSCQCKICLAHNPK